MNDTGRLTATVGVRTQRIVYGEPSDAAIAGELRLGCTVDRAHLVMLVRCGLIDRATATKLLCHIELLAGQDFAPLRGRPMPRGLYLAYESHLSEVLGADVGGRLHTGRSRNDLKATVTALRLRAVLDELVSALGRLQAVLLSRARAHHAVVMPIHTHYQAALPITYGYYLAGVALALGREIGALRHAADGLARCPLGAGAAAGSELPIAPELVAALLGFDGPPRHALDTVASRDVAVRALAAAAGAALLTSRLGTDLQLWSTAEFGFVAFPDRLVGGSSAMPQKRNAFLLEHVRAKAGTAIGAWTAAAAMTRSTPFTNSIEVGTEAVAEILRGLRAVADAAELCQSLVSGARPRPDAMLAAAQHGHVAAMTLANRLVGAGTPFRTAHEQVGRAVRRAVERGDARLSPADLPAELAGLDLALPALTGQQRAGGGPGEFDAIFADAHADLAAHAAWAAARRAKFRQAARELAGAVAELTGAAR